jgi:hypothetical protein
MKSREGTGGACRLSSPLGGDGVSRACGGGACVGRYETIIHPTDTVTAKAKTSMSHLFNVGLAMSQISIAVYGIANSSA